MGKLSRTYSEILIITVLIIAVCITLFSFGCLKRNDSDKKATFSLGLGQEADVNYDFYYRTGVHAKYGFLFSLNSIDVPQQKVEFSITETHPAYPTPYVSENITLNLNEKFTWFVTEEGGIHFKLIGLEDTKATLETWFEVGPPHPIGPLAPKEVFIR